MERVEAENADLRKTLNDDKQITGSLQYLLTVREGNVFRSICLFTLWGARGVMEGNVFRSVCLLTGGMMSLPVWYHLPSGRLHPERGWTNKLLVHFNIY